MGTYAAVPGAPSCTPCAAGTFANVTGLSSCYACSPGFYSAEQATLCSYCPENTHAATAGSANCASCYPQVSPVGSPVCCVTLTQAGLASGMALKSSFSFVKDIYEYSQKNPCVGLVTLLGDTGAVLSSFDKLSENSNFCAPTPPVP